MSENVTAAKNTSTCLQFTTRPEQVAKLSAEDRQEYESSLQLKKHQKVFVQMRAHVSIRKSIGQLVSRSPLSFSYVRKFGSPLVRAKKLITEHTHAPDKYNRYSLKIKFVLVLPTLTRAPERYFLQMLYTSNMCIHRSIPDYFP